MSFITGWIAGFVSFPLIAICAIMIYGSKKGWDKPEKSEPVKEYEYKGNIDYIKHGKTGYVNKTEINKIINKSKMC